MQLGFQGLGSNPETWNRKMDRLAGCLPSEAGKASSVSFPASVCQESASCGSGVENNKLVISGGGGENP